MGARYVVAKSRYERLATCSTDDRGEFLGRPEALAVAENLPLVQYWEVFAATFALRDWLRFCATWAFWSWLPCVKRIVVNVVHEYKVLKAVVVFYVVDVVHNLNISKRPPNVFRHNNHMLLNIALRVSVWVRLVMNHNVPLANSSSNPLRVVLVTKKNPVVQVLACLGAVVVFVFLIPTSMSFIWGRALFANSCNHGEAPQNG
jgi:hypothetical protein